MNLSKTWKAKLEAASFFAVYNPIQAVCDIKVTNLFFPFQASIAAERERGRGRLVDKEKEDFLTSSEKPQKRLKVSEQNLDADDPLGKFKAFIEIFYEKCYNIFLFCRLK